MMIKTMLLLLPALLMGSALAAQTAYFANLQRDLGIQAAAFRDSPEQQALRQRDPRSYNVGDTHTFWRWNLSVMPPGWIQTPATCRAVGEHTYVFVADSEWNVHMDQADVNEVLLRLEDSTVNDPGQGAIEMDVSLFGPVPDVLDNDPRLIVFYSALGSFQGNYFDGYFSPYNQVTEAQAQQMNPPGHSNECEMIYMTCYPLDPVAPVRLSVLAHELQHLIHWGQDANEESWVNEGCAELAMVAYGVPDPISGFPSNPDNNLTAWNQSFADYVKVMLFFTYLQEHYDATGLISGLVADPANGLASLNQQLAIHHPEVTFSDLFSNWATANVIDSETAQNPLWGYTQLDLPPFASTMLAEVPDLQNQTIQPYATDYLRLNCTAWGRMISFSSDQPMRIRTVRYDYDDSCLGVDEEGAGTLIEVFAPTLPLTDHVRFVLTNTNPISVSYSLSTVVPNDDPTQVPATAASLALYPNPFCPKGQPLRIELAGQARDPGSLEIFNSKGQMVRRFAADEVSESQPISLSWDGLDGSGNPAPGGIYLLRWANGTEHAFKKLCLIK